MKKTILYILFSIVSFSLSANDLIESATQAYTQGDYAEAVELYLQALETEGESAHIYYNLGNSYYRMNRIAPAILNYERALLFDPSDKDTRFNLEIARLKTVDKIEPVGEFFLTDWYNGVKNSRSTNQWSYLAIACFLLFVGGMVLFFFSRRITLKKIGFYSGIALLVVCFVCNTFAYNQKKDLTQRDTAVIFSPTTTIKSSPDNSGTDLFILHEGTKVSIKSTLGEWSEIETADGNVGWIQTQEIEVI